MRIGIGHVSIIGLLCTLLMVFAAYIVLPTYICTPEPYQVYYDPNISLNIPVQVYPCEIHKVSSTAISKDISGSILTYNMSLFTHHLCSNEGLSAEIPFKTTEIIVSNPHMLGLLSYISYVRNPLTCTITSLPYAPPVLCSPHTHSHSSLFSSHLIIPWSTYDDPKYFLNIYVQAYHRIHDINMDHKIMPRASIFKNIIGSMSCNTFLNYNSYDGDVVLWTSDDPIKELRNQYYVISYCVGAPLYCDYRFSHLFPSSQLLYKSSMHSLHIYSFVTPRTGSRCESFCIFLYNLCSCEQYPYKSYESLSISYDYKSISRPAFVSFFLLKSLASLWSITPVTRSILVIALSGQVSAQ